MTSSRPTRLLIAVLILFGLLAAACGSDDDSATSADSGFAREATDDSAEFDTVDTGGDDAMQDAPAATTAPEEAEKEGDGVGAGPAPTGDLTAADIGREIIFTATVAVEVENVDAAGRQASEIIDDLGGFIFGQNTVGGSEPRSEITFKVLPDRFGEALERLAGIGELRNQTITTDDVTERVVDLNSRIEVAALGVERLREAMENATDLEDFAALESLLLSRESDLEVMRGQLRTLRDRIDLATITLILSQDRIENSVQLDFTAYEGHDDGVSCPGEDVSDLRVEEDAEVTLCFEIRNTGDQNLTDIQITESVLDLETSDLIDVFGDLDVLAPAQSAIRAFEFRPERNQAFRVNVTAIPNDGVSVGPSGPTVSTRTSPVLRATAAESDPGFGDGFGAAVNVLAAIWLAITVTIGFLLPLLVLIPFLYIGWRIVRWLGKRAQERREIAERERREEEARVRREQAQTSQEESTPPPPTGPGRVTSKAFDTADEDE